MKNYTDEYIDRLFQAWYSLNQPSDMERVITLVGVDGDGKTPEKSTVKQWAKEYGWQERADGMTALAVQKAEDMLITQKAEMLKRQAMDAFEVAVKAKEHIIVNGFDTTSSAVAALKWATEEERTARGVSEMMIRVSKMSKEELEARAIKLLQRTNDVIDAEEVDSANSSTEASD